MFCSSCGKQISEGSKFCNFCGSIQTIITQPAAPAAKTVPPVNQTLTQVNTQPVAPASYNVQHVNSSVPSKKKSSKGVKGFIIGGACLLVFLIIIFSVIVVPIIKNDGKVINNVAYLPTISEFCAYAEAVESGVDVWENTFDDCDSASAFMDRGYGPSWHLYVYHDSSRAYDLFSECYSAVETDVYDDVVFGDLYYKDNKKNGYILFNVTTNGDGEFFRYNEYFYGGIFFSGNKRMDVYVKQDSPLKKSEMDRIDNVLTMYGLPNPRTGSKNISWIDKISMNKKKDIDNKTLEQLVNNKKQQELNDGALYGVENSDFYDKAEYEFNGNDVTIKFYFKLSTDYTEIAKVRSTMGLQEESGELDERINADKNGIEHSLGKRPDSITYIFYDSDGGYLFKYGGR